MTCTETRLPSPRELSSADPPSTVALQSIERARAAVRAIVDGSDSRFLLVVGPCSIHDEQSALEYATRLSRLAERVSDEAVVCMRVYFEKPRTCSGWKGFVHDPELDGSGDVLHGLARSRALMLRIAELGLGVATELLDPLLAEYHSEVVAWAAIGARTSESQVHRELASSRPFAIGFKNGTDGNVQGAINSVLAAARPHTRFGIDSTGRAVVSRSAGNPHCHVVLRGGSAGPNCDDASVAAAARALGARGARPAVLVDCSHGNSGKEPSAQARVFQELSRQLARGVPVFGAMLESHLVEGRQDPAPLDQLRYGQSVTDACIDFRTTERLVERLCRTLRDSRSQRSPARRRPAEFQTPPGPSGLADCPLPVRSSSASP